MKPEDLEVGRAYTNGRGRFRVIVGAGPHLARRADQHSLDVFRARCYRWDRKSRCFVLDIIPGGLQGDSVCTRDALARWADREATFFEMDEVISEAAVAALRLRWALVVSRMTFASPPLSHFLPVGDLP